MRVLWINSSLNQTPRAQEALKKLYPNPEKSDSSRERLYQPIKFQTRNMATRTVTGVTTRSKSRTTQDPSEPAGAEIYRSPWTRDSSYHGEIEFKIQIPRGGSEGSVSRGRSPGTTRGLKSPTTRDLTEDRADFFTDEGSLAANMGEDDEEIRQNLANISFTNLSEEQLERYQKVMDEDTQRLKAEIAMDLETSKRNRL